MVTTLGLLGSILAALAAAVVSVPGDAAAGSRTAAIIEAAIAKGAPAYNEGRVEQSLSFYRDATRQILALPDDQVSPMDRHYLGKPFASTAKKLSDQAWELRRAFTRGALSIWGCQKAISYQFSLSGQADRQASE